MISIVVPVYNIKPYIRECVESVLKQSYNDWECILVNDGSTDGSNDICQELAFEDKRITVVCQNNSGLAAARNTGLLHSKGDFVFFLDGDDKIKPETLSNFIRELNECPDSDFVIGHMASFTESSEPVPFPNIVKKEWVVGKNGKVAFKEIHDRLSVMMMGVRGLYRRKFLLDNDLLFKAECRYSEDQEWTPRIFEKAQALTSCETPDYLYRIGREGSLMNTLNPGKIELTLQIYDGWYTKARENAANEFGHSLYDVLMRRYWSFFFLYPPQLAKSDLPTFYDMMDRRKVFARRPPFKVKKGIHECMICLLPSKMICCLTQNWKKLREGLHK